jgi:hypothetical protein
MYKVPDVVYCDTTSVDGPVVQRRKLRLGDIGSLLKVISVCRNLETSRKERLGHFPTGQEPAEPA